MREVHFEIEGDGRLDAAKATTNEEGTGEFKYYSPNGEGKAVITPVHKYEIIIVGEHNGPLAMHWQQDNTRGGMCAKFSEDIEKWPGM